MNTFIWKYEIPLSKEFTLQLPAGAKILHINTQHNVPYMWCKVHSGNQKVKRFFEVLPTGVAFPSIFNDREYLGTFLIEGGDLVFHLYEHIKA